MRRAKGFVIRIKGFDSLYTTVYDKNSSVQPLTFSLNGGKKLSSALNYMDFKARNSYL